jgi:hypothetical protein
MVGHTRILLIAIICLLSFQFTQAQQSKRREYIKQRRVGDLKVGDDAPDFKLDAADGSKTVQLSSFEGQRDVVLIFGSYT